MIHEGLFYGKKLDHSLTNPNQLRSYGIEVWDNPFNKERELGIHVDGLSVPMKTKGTKIRFETRVPTDQELRECKMIELTSRGEWNPGDVTLESTKSARHINELQREPYDDDTVALGQRRSASGWGFPIKWDS